MKKEDASGKIPAFFASHKNEKKYKKEKI